MIIASPETIQRLKQQKKLRSCVLLSKPVQAAIPDPSLKDNINLRKASNELEEAHRILIEHGYQPAREYSDHDLSRSYMYPGVNTIRIWQQAKPGGGCSIQFDSAKSSAASNGSKKQIPSDKLVPHLEQVDKYYGRKLEAGGPGSGQYQHVGTYKSGAKEILQPQLDQKKIRHQWQGKKLLVHPDDVKQHGPQYGWTWKQRDLFSSIEAGGPPSDKGPGSGNYDHKKTAVINNMRNTLVNNGYKEIPPEFTDPELIARYKKGSASVSLLKDGKWVYLNPKDHAEQHFLEPISSGFPEDLEERISNKYLYHGTSDKYEDDIKTKGLIPGRRKKLANSSDARVYLTPNKSLAMDEAERTVDGEPGTPGIGGRPIVFRIEKDKLPAGIKFKNDYEYTQNGMAARFTHSAIPRDAIHSTIKKDAGTNWITPDWLSRQYEHDVQAGGPPSDKGPGSGHYDHESKGRLDKSALAKASYKPSTRAKQLIADQSEAVLSKNLKIPRTANNSAFDLQNDSVGVEVKTLIDNKNDKITMHPESLRRKLAEAAKQRLKPFTVVIDTRGEEPTYYWRQGLGSFNVKNLMKASSIRELKKMLKKKQRG